MVERGAKNVVLLSRSGITTSKVKELIEESIRTGAQITVKRCDVSNSESVASLISNELLDMPEVKGVVHAAMVLHVKPHFSLLELQLTYAGRLV